MELNWAQQPLPVVVTDLPSSGWSSEAVTTLIISGVAIVLSAIALVWQIFSWRRSGSRTIINADSGISWGGMGTFEIMSFAVSNRGRAPTQVSSVDFVRAGGKGTVTFFPDAFLQGKFPLDLQPGRQETLVVRLDELARICADNHINPSELKPRARSGHGDVTGKTTSLLVRRLRELVAKSREEER